MDEQEQSLSVRVRSLELGAELYAQSMEEALRQREVDAPREPKWTTGIAP